MTDPLALDPVLPARQLCVDDRVGRALAKRVDEPARVRRDHERVPLGMRDEERWCTFALVVHW